MLAGLDTIGLSGLDAKGDGGRTPLCSAGCVELAEGQDTLPCPGVAGG